MADAVSIFIRRPIPVTFAPEGDEPITISVYRLPARHAFAWDELWAKRVNPELLEYTFEQMQDLMVAACCAAIPEPDTTCPKECPCWTGRSGVHELIRRLGREELDELFRVCLDVNGPKDVATVGATVAESVSTRPWVGSLWRAWPFLRPSLSRSKKSDTSYKH